MAHTKRHSARDAADSLLLPSFVHMLYSRDLEIPGRSQQSQIGTIFWGSLFLQQKIALLQKEGGRITIYVQNYNTSMFPGSDSSIRWVLNKTEKGHIRMLWMSIYGQHFPSAAKNLKEHSWNNPEKRNSLMPWKNRISWQFTTWSLSFCKRTLHFAGTSGGMCKNLGNNSAPKRKNDFLFAVSIRVEKASHTRWILH